MPFSTFLRAVCRGTQTLSRHHARAYTSKIYVRSMKIYYQLEVLDTLHSQKKTAVFWLDPANPVMPRSPSRTRLCWQAHFLQLLWRHCTVDHVHRSLPKISLKTSQCYLSFCPRHPVTFYVRKGQIIANDLVFSADRGPAIVLRLPIIY